MELNHSFSKLPGIVFILLLISCNIELRASAAVEFVPLWNVTTSQDSTDSCLLIHGINEYNSTTLIGNQDGETCSVQLTTSLGSGTRIQIPKPISPDTLLYVEKQGDLLNCPNRYVVIEADKPCLVAFSHTKLQLFLQGNASILISDTSINKSMSLCENTQAVSEKSEISYSCPTTNSNHTISCYPSPDHICSFEKFPSDCTATLGKGYVDFKCHGDTAHLDHTSFIIYPNDVITLDLYGQNIAEIAENAFAHLKHLDEINIAKNRLSRVHSKAFTGLQSLKILDMRENQLTTFEPHVFDDLATLIILILSYNKLAILPNGLFSNLGNLHILHIDENQLTSLSANLLQGTSELTRLHLENNQITSLDANLLKETSKLTRLYLQNNQLTSLDGNLLQDTSKLTHLYLNNNMITSIDADLLKKTSKLVYLYLDNNHLTSLDVKLLKETGNLERLGLSNNHLTSIEANLMKETRKLTDLYLSNNRLTSLDANLLKETSELTKLYLDNNRLTSLDENLLNATSKLTHLFLSKNQLTSLDENLLKKTSELTQLYLENNQLTSIDANLLTEAGKLDVLNLHNNQLTSLNANLLNKTSKLTHLYLHENMLRTLPRRFFNALPDLQILVVNGNKLTNVSYDLFWKMRNLTYLNLGYNYLTQLNPRVFDGLKNLQLLYLDYNQIYELDLHVFKDTTNLRLLDLSGNQLTNIPNINNLNQLIFIGLRGNKLTMIDKYTFIGLPNQTEIVVNQTEICECYEPRGINCSALDVRSPYLTCDRLLSDRVLVVMMWLIGLNALGGNLFVLIRTKTGNEKRIIQTFLLNNLAVSDLLMGIYMIIIASADIYFGEYFPMQAETWRSGITCRIAGAISILSSEASVFFVTLISMDRFVNIRFPFSGHKLRKTSSAVIVTLIWLVSLAIAIIPSVLAGASYTFYDNSHVCIGLPLAQVEFFYKNITQETIDTVSGFLGTAVDWSYIKYVVKSESLGHVPGLYYSSAIFLGLNSICYLVILFCYMEIVRFVYESSKRVGLNKGVKEQIRMTTKVAAIVLTDFLCWAPVIVLGILVQVGVLTLPPSVFAWSVTVILPINSAINPYLYTIASLISNRRKQARRQTLNSRSQLRTISCNQPMHSMEDSNGEEETRCVPLHQ
ncbi:uncharacterized protein [Amphiura filiformis]|uniref:uncharacterized protein n=1 Tax=Amphiura filiformis TaxID=82378 RepID=UPI003B21C444